MAVVSGSETGRTERQVMPAKTDHLVSAEEFRQHLDKYVRAARRGQGPVAVTEDSEVVGFFIGREQFEAMFGTAVKKLLSTRAKGSTVPHEEVCSQVREIIGRHARKS
jgi:prevent-host-death family protein